eukprot:551937_1
MDPGRTLPSYKGITSLRTNPIQIQQMQTYIIIAVTTIICYGISSWILDYMDGIKREEWNVAQFEEELQRFTSIKYNCMSNLSLLETNQNKLYGYNHMDDGDISIDELKEHLLLYIQSVNNSKHAIDESVLLLQSIYDSCTALIDVALHSKTQQMQNSTLSDYNPVQLMWNIYYLYTGTAMEEKCKDYLNILNSFKLSMKRILSIQRDFVRHTQFSRLLNKIEAHSNLMIQVTFTIDFLDELLSFESS